MTTASDPFSAEAAAAAQFFSGGSVTAAKFPKNGAIVEGTVTEFRLEQRTHMESKEPLFWEGKKPTEQTKLKFPQTSIKPVMQMVITLQGEPTFVTWETNRYIERKLEEDDGLRALYVSSPELQKAIGKALADKGTRAPEVGGYLKVAKTGEQRVEGTSFSKFLYAAQWTPATQNEKAAGDFLSSTEGGAPVPDPFK